MASKSAQGEQVSTETIEELLDAVDKTLDRVKTLYEQYFLGIQKQAPTFLHTDIERKLRDLTQMQIRNTGMRYRLATLQQKFGAYNSYWKRTVRQIENGTYLRNLSKIGREAVRTGAEIPEEILAAMPKRMREQVVRDREQAIAAARRRGGDGVGDDELQPPDADELAAQINEPSQLRRDLKTQSGAHIIDESDGDLDLASFFASVEQESVPAAAPTPAPKPLVAPPPPPVAPPPPEPPKAAPNVRAAAIGPPPVAKRISSTQIPTIAIPKIPPSQATRPNPVTPGAAAAKGPVPVESMAGPFPRPAPTAPAKPAAPAAAKPAGPPQRPPGMTEADVNALYVKYVQAKQLVGEAAGPGAREKLLKTINAQAPKIMEQYKAKAVDFSIVVKDNQVIIRAKPKL